MAVLAAILIPVPLVKAQAADQTIEEALFDAFTASLQSQQPADKRAATASLFFDNDTDFGFTVEGCGGNQSRSTSCSLSKSLVAPLASPESLNMVSQAVKGSADITALAPSPPANPTCMPTCASNDGVFLVIVEDLNFGSLTGPEARIEFSSPAAASDIVIGIFDGDSGAGGSDHWDFGTGTLELNLFADPQGDGTGAVSVYSNTDFLNDAGAFPDNAWVDFLIPNDVAAQMVVGVSDFFYTLEITLIPDPPSVINAFKLRTDGIVTTIPAEPFSFIANVASCADAQILHPAFDCLAPFDLSQVSPTTYDGSISFFLNALVH